MRLLDLFKAREPATTARAAKERLQILLAHERVGRGGAEFLPMLQRELLQVIQKYVQIDNDKIQVRLDRNEDTSMLEVNIELPGSIAAMPRREPTLA